MADCRHCLSFVALLLPALEKVRDFCSSCSLPDYAIRSKRARLGPPADHRNPKCLNITGPAESEEPMSELSRRKFLKGTAALATPIAQPSIWAQAARSTDRGTQQLPRFRSRRRHPVITSRKP